MAEASDDPAPGRPGPRARVRRLLHPHRRTVARLSLAIIVAIAVLAGVGGAIRSLRADGRPPIGPDEVGELRVGRTWDLDAGPVTGLASEGDMLYASTRAGLVALRVPCPQTAEGPCGPAWRAPVPGGPLSAPVLTAGRVLAGSATGLVYAFPASCAAELCEPEWVGVAGRDRVSEPGVNDDFVYVTSDRLYAFPAACGTDDRICAPVWSATLPGRPSGAAPAVGGGVVVVTSSAAGGTVLAFPAVCPARCQPLWEARIPGRPGGAAIEDGMAYVAAGGRVVAFPLSCRQVCTPEWSGAFTPGRTRSPGAIGPPLPHDGKVFVGDREGVLWRFAATCPQRVCRAEASFGLSKDPLLAPVAEGGVVYAVATGGALHAVVERCEAVATPCGEAFTVALGAGAEAPALASGGAVYAGDIAGRVRTFTLPAAR